MEIACILANYFEDSEFRVPFDRLSASGHHVVVVGQVAGEQLVGKHQRETVIADRGIDEVRPDQFAGLLIPGGFSPDQLRNDARFVDFVRAFAKAAKPIFAICHGPQILITADVVRGRTMTSWPTVMVDLRNAGAKVVDRPVVVDGNLITSRKPADLEAFSREANRLLAGDAAAHP